MTNAVCTSEERRKREKERERSHSHSRAGRLTYDWPPTGQMDL